MQVAEPPATAPAAPLGGEHHEIERRGLLDLQPRRTAAARGVARVERLGHDSLVAGAAGLFDEGRRLAGTGREHTGHQPPAARKLREDAGATAERVVNQVLPVHQQAVEEERGQGQRAAQGVDVELAPEAAHRDLERKRRAIGSERQHLPIEDQPPRQHGAHRLDHFGNRRGHVAQVAREHPDLGPVLVHLHAGAVQLVVERHRAEARQGIIHAVRGLRQHRLHGVERAERELRQSRVGPGQRSPGYRSEAAGHHHGTAHPGRRQSGRARHGVGDHALERALANLTVEQPHQEVLLVGRRPRQQIAELLDAGRRRAAASRSRHVLEHTVNGCKRQYGCGCSRGGTDLAQSGEADPDTPLR